MDAKSNIILILPKSSSLDLKWLKQHFQPTEKVLRKMGSTSGGGGNLVLFMVRGRAICYGCIFQTATSLWVSFFTIFRHLMESWVPFSRDFSEFPELWPRFSFDLQNYDPKTHENLRNYGHQFFGQNGTSPSDNRSRYPPPPEGSTWRNI